MGRTHSYLSFVICFLYWGTCCFNMNFKPKAWHEKWLESDISTMVSKQKVAAESQSLPFCFYQLWNTTRYSLDGIIDYIKNVGTCQQCHHATCFCVRVGSPLPVQEDTQNVCSASDSAIHNIYTQSMIRWAITTVHHHSQFLVQMRRPAFSAIMRTATCMQPSDLYFSICWVVTHGCVWFEIALVIVL
jgi:hypothetical protein